MLYFYYVQVQRFTKVLLVTQELRLLVPLFFKCSSDNKHSFWIKLLCLLRLLTYLLKVMKVIQKSAILDYFRKLFEIFELWCLDWIPYVHKHRVWHFNHLSSPIQYKVTKKCLNSAILDISETAWDIRILISEMDSLCETT